MLKTNFREMRPLINAHTVVFLSLLCSVPAFGISIGIGPGCGSCQGSVYDVLDVGPGPLPDADPSTETYNLLYTIDTTNYNGGGGGAIDSVALKVAAAANIQSVMLLDAPGGVGNWQLLAGGINAGGCHPNPNNGFQCADYVGIGVGTAVAALGGTVPLEWLFEFTVNNGSLFLGQEEAKIKARYVDIEGDKIGDLVSEEIIISTVPETPIPEPATLYTLGLGLLGMLAHRRRKRGNRHSAP